MAKKKKDNKFTKKVITLAEKFKLIKVRNFSYETKSDGSGLRSLQNFIKDKCYKFGLLQEDVYNIILATDEAFTNIMKHGYKYEVGDVLVDMEFHYFSRFVKIIIHLKDKTIGFDWQSVPSPDLENYVKSQKKGGFGIFLIKNLVDNISSRKDDLFNILTLEKFARRPFLFGVGIKWPLIILLVLFLLSSGVFWLFQQRRENAFRDDIFTGIERSLNDFAGSVQLSMMESNYEELALVVNSFIEENNYLTKMFILDSHNRIIATTELEEFLTVYTQPDLVSIKENSNFRYFKVKPDELLLRYDPSFNGKSSYVIYTNIDNSLITAEVADLHQRNLKNFLLFLLIGGIVTIILVIYFFVSPVKKLFDGVMEIESGKLSRPHTMRGKDEFSQIKRIFNEFAMRFEETRNTLTDAQRELLAHELLKKEMQVAQNIQQTLLPKKFPELEGFELDAFYKSAKEVGGDYYDFIPISKNKLGIIVADVSGKGVPGSMVMTMIRTAVRLIAPQSRSAKDVMIKLNQLIQNDLHKGMFITIYFVILDTKRQVLQFSSAGHTPMILYRTVEDKLYSLNPKGIPIGLKLKEKDLFNRSIKSEEIDLKKGDLIIIYTDGITEAMNDKFEQYTIQRFIDKIRKFGLNKLDVFRLKLEEDVTEFIGNHQQNDDITMVIIKDIQEREFESESKYSEIQFIPQEILDKMLNVIRENPEFGVTRIKKILQKEGINLSPKLIRKELARLNLSNRKKRETYSKYTKR